ncbi:CTLH/CRA C-terminal to lish motif domain-containing protein [Scheffersomyces amazonensis]|uniref:CTLH/CRA C-terminal to lish motif domain-containing protein n=1 Tax=Scheffersomyces amazonensis TaxID=1078765 RepID=UPI00315D86EE
MTNIPKEKINNLILNYFIQEGYQEAAVSFSKELNMDVFKTLEESKFDRTNSSNANDKSMQLIKRMNSLNNNEFTNMVEHYFGDVSNEGVGSSSSNNYSIQNNKTSLVSGYSTISQRKEIKLLILKGSITEAIKKISEYFPTILDTNNLLHFKLLRLNLIEMIRDHKLNANIKDESDESIFLNSILTFVRENLINKVSNSFKLLKELEITMSLLCFNFDPTVQNIEDQKDLPEELRMLFDLSLRNQCYRLVNKSILSLYGNNSDNANNVNNDENDYNFLNQEGLEDQNEYSINKLDQANISIYKGPKFVEYDLNGFSFYNADTLSDEVEEEGDDEDIEDIDYEIEYDKTLSQFISSNTSPQDFWSADGTNSTGNNKGNIDDELSKLQSLSLESKLERIIKLWTITEQRLLDLNIIKQKRYLLNDEL